MAVPNSKESQEAKVLVKLAQYHKISFNGKNVSLSDFLIHIPNGGMRNPLEARNLQLQGVKAGVSDYLLAIPSAHYHGAWIELKRAEKRATVTAEQITWIYRMRDAGYFADVAYGADEAFKLIINYLQNPVELKLNA
jgi:hypothetical protein